jgi:Cu/Ag efflux protein CusF
MHFGTIRFWQSALTLALLASAGSAASLPARGDSNEKKPIAFSGRVESVDLQLRTVEITHGPIPGYLPAMTNDYPIDNKILLTQLKPGDEIAATVYVGDPTLHDVHVLNRNSSDRHH